MGCVFSREVWTRCCISWGFPAWTPRTGESLEGWLCSRTASRRDIRDLRTSLALVVWALWNHRNDIVFDGATPSVGRVLEIIRVEGETWRVAGLFKGSLGQAERWRCGE